MQWALPGFVCLTALQELLLAHREHYSVDLLAAGVRRGETKGGGGGGGVQEKMKIGDERRDEMRETRDV